MYIKKKLEVLALSSEEQIKYLISLGTYPSADELALEFDDAYYIFRADYYEGKIELKDKSFMQKIDKINLAFKKMSSLHNADLWDVASLDREEWKHIRLLASDALKLI